VGSLFTREPKATKRRTSRRERDQKRKRWLYIALAVAGIAIVGVLSVTALNEYFLKPRKVLATVEGEDITRRDYWKYREHTLINQSLQYQNFAMISQGQQQQQYLALAQQAQAQLDDVWGSTSVDEATLSRMIEDRIHVEGLESLGLSITNQEVTDYIDSQFAGADAPIFTSTPSPTLIPERAEWATQTAAALNPEAGTPLAVDASPETLVASPAATTAQEGTIIAGSPIAVASPEESATVTPTLGPDDARATSAANFENYQDSVLDEAHMSIGDYRRLVAEPTLAREKVNAYFTSELGQSTEQVHAAHILVGTEELARQLYEQVSANPDQFASVAMESSFDEGTAPNGGDLGWFPRGVMVEPFEEVAFALSPGEISEPFQTEFGWHILTVLERDEDRPLTDAQISQASQGLAQRWISEQRETFDISHGIDPTPTPAMSQFVPPAEAPPPPSPTPDLEAGTPVALPAVDVDASPGAIEGSTSEAES
jgi:parvulin-like peptidyl-prolyl isomerase